LHSVFFLKNEFAKLELGWGRMKLYFHHFPNPFESKGRFCVYPIERTFLLARTNTTWFNTLLLWPFQKLGFTKLEGVFLSLNWRISKVWSWELLFSILAASFSGTDNHKRHWGLDQLRYLCLNGRRSTQVLDHFSS
jgi:hypothetical protein